MNFRKIEAEMGIREPSDPRPGSELRLAAEAARAACSGGSRARFSILLRDFDSFPEISNFYFTGRKNSEKSL